MLLSLLLVPRHVHLKLMMDRNKKVRIGNVEAFCVL